MASRHADPDAGTSSDVPTPESVLAFLREANRTVELAAIASHFGVQPPQIAAQVEALRERGLIVPCRAGPRRSRRDRYAAALAEEAAPETQDAYLGLSELLLDVLVGGRDPDEVGRTAGRRLASARTSSGPHTPSDTLAELQRFLESHGFRPTEIRHEANVGFVLGRCPFEKAALTNPLVCGLHRALAEGMVDGLGGAYEVTDLVARNPKTAGCRLELRSTLHSD